MNFLQCRLAQYLRLIALPDKSDEQVNKEANGAWHCLFAHKPHEFLAVLAVINNFSFMRSYPAVFSRD